MKGVSLITRDRLVLLDLFFHRCEVRLRGRLAERVRQQVHEEAAADLAVHRQLMRPSSGAAGTAATVTADIVSATAAAAAGRRSGRTKRTSGGNRGSGEGDDDAVGELMETVAALRLKSALEELETRSARPDVKHRLLEGLLLKVAGPSSFSFMFLSTKYAQQFCVYPNHPEMGKGCNEEFDTNVEGVDAVCTHVQICTKIQ